MWTRRTLLPHRVAERKQLLPFAALSASYFAHIGFFNPYLPLWLKELGFGLIAISVLTSVQSATRLFAPYAWGTLSDRTGERVKLLRYGATVALLLSVGLWFPLGGVALFVVLLLMFTHTSAMMPMSEAALAHLVSQGGAFDAKRYGRVRLWGSLGFLITVMVAGWWFERFGMGHFPAWTLVTLIAVVVSVWLLPDHKEAVHHDDDHPAVWPLLQQPAVRWFFASLFFHVMAHFSIYGFLSLYLDARGYGKALIGALWAVSVLVEIGWFFLQGRLIGRLNMQRWLVVCGAATALRMLLTGAAGDWLVALVLAQLLHALTFATHHTACIALVSQHVPGRLRGRGQALFTVIGYGLGGVLGVLAGGAVASRWGFEPLFLGAAVLGAIATACAWQVGRTGTNIAA